MPAPASPRALLSHAEHRATEEARPDRRQAAARDPALPVDRLLRGIRLRPEAFRSLGPADARGVERLSVPDARDVAVEAPDDPADRTVARPGLLELAVAGGEDAADVTPRPGVRERESRDL